MIFFHDGLLFRQNECVGEDINIVKGALSHCFRIIKTLRFTSSASKTNGLSNSRISNKPNN